MAENSLSKCNDSSKFGLDSFGDDMLFQILHRLPRKSTISYQIVSKRWLSMISKPTFLPPFFRHHLALFQKQKNHEKYQQYLFYLSASYVFVILLKPKALASESLSLSLSFLGTNKVEVFNYSNGLLLCRGGGFGNGIYYVCNPLTKRWIEIPRLSKTDGYSGFVCEPYIAIEAEDAALSSHALFWVVHIPQFQGRKFMFEVMVFSSKTGEWRESLIVCVQEFEFRDICYPGIAHNGMLHFMGLGNILVFHSYGDDWHTIDYPATVTHNAWLGVSCGNLRLSFFPVCESEVDCSKVIIWELLDFDSETGEGTWHLLHEVSLCPSIWKRFGISTPSCAPFYISVVDIALHPHDDTIIYFQYIGRVFCCNLHTKELTVVAEKSICHLILPIVLPWMPTTIPSIAGPSLPAQESEQGAAPNPG